MEVRINTTAEGPQTVIHIAGRLAGVAVAQLSEACDSIESSLVLDLTDLMSANTAGIDVIRTLEESGAELRGASPFVQLLLDDSTGIPDRPRT